MNVLLAEAEVPYDKLLEMDQVNPMFSETDVAIVIGANDVVNPVARSNPDSPIYGMPIIDVDHARTCIVMKRSLNPGFAGVDNPLEWNTLYNFWFDCTAAPTAGTVQLDQDTALERRRLLYVGEPQGTLEPFPPGGDRRRGRDRGGGPCNRLHPDAYERRVAICAGIRRPAA